MTEKDNEVSENSTKCCIYNNDYIDNDFKVSDIVISLENIEVLYIETLISMLS